MYYNNHLFHQNIGSKIMVAEEESEEFPPARQGTILNSYQVIGIATKYLNGAKLRLSDLHNDDSRCRTAGCSLTSYPGHGSEMNALVLYLPTDIAVL